MNLLTVIPIAKGISKDALTYFSKEDVGLGSIVSIPLRKKKIHGLVVKSEKVEDMKSELKSLTYSIKKIEHLKTSSFLPSWFIESAQDIADYTASSLGAVIYSLLPKSILEESATLSYVPTENKNRSFHETLLLQTDDEDRYATYKSLIREEFAKGRSIFFCLPGTEDILNARQTLEKGIEQYTYVFHSGLSKKEIVSLWKKVVEENHAVLIIATGAFLSLPREDIGAIILEKESSRAYKSQSRPFIDIRQAAEIIAKKSSRRLILGDNLLRVETIWDEKNPTGGSSYGELSPLKFRSVKTASVQMIDSRSPADMKKKEFKILSGDLKELISNTRKNNEHLFLFCGRKGLFPMTVCSDCGTTVVCTNCSSPMVLYGKTSPNGHSVGRAKKEKGATESSKSKNVFVCHHCGERRSADELCKHCRGWRLLPLGIGVESVINEISTLFPETKLFVMDKDHLSTHKQAVKVRNTFYNTPGAILVGTEMALTYLNNKIENTAVISMDSFFSIPDFRINEKIFHILLTMRALSEKRMLIQTRRDQTSSGYKLFSYAMQGNLLDFYRDEIEERKSLGYPPFATHIKITLEGEKTAVQKKMTETAKSLEPYKTEIYQAWIPGGKSKYTVHGLITLQRGQWVDKNLLAKLRALPPQYSIKIDPDTLL